MQQAIYLENLSFSWQKHQILQDISLSIPRGGLNILLGVNGSGKSTLMRIIANLQRNYQGKVYILDKDARSLSTQHRARSIGFLGQFFHLVFPFKVMDLLLTGTAAFSYFQPKARDYARMQEVLAMLQIPQLKHKLFTQLSGGEQQLVLIARLLMQNPAILLLDEPTNHLDIYYQNQVLAQLKSLSQQGYTVLCTLHNPTQAFLFADRILFMHQGQLLSPSVAELADGKLLAQIYGVPFQKIPLDSRIYPNQHTFLAI